MASAANKDIHESATNSTELDDLGLSKADLVPVDGHDVALQIIDGAGGASVDPAITRRALRKIDMWILPLLA